MVAQGLEKMGEAGAQQYLNLYGKGIAAPKCILMAAQAQLCGYPQVALGFWKKAYELETGGSAVGQTGDAVVSDVGNPVPKPVSQWVDENFPPSLQPGRLATMQPSDAQLPRLDYIVNDAY